MKRYCKDIDITDIDFIVAAIQDWRSHRRKHDLERSDVRRLYAHFNNDARKIAEELSKEIRERDLKLSPVRVKELTDTSNGKRRTACVESAKQQMLDYVAIHGLQPIMGRVGEYQCTGLPGRGTIWGLKRLMGWYQDPSIRYVCQVDIVQNYGSTTAEMVRQFLETHINNPPLIWLIYSLVGTNPLGGLPIGSPLSVHLDALYLSQAYHYIKEGMYRIRRGRRVPLVKHALFFVDDIAMLCSSYKDAAMAERLLRSYMSGIGLQLHEKYIITRVSETHYQDMLGFREYREHVTMRRRNYIKIKAALRTMDHAPTIYAARRLVSMNGFIKYSDSYRFRKKYHTKRLLKKARRYIAKYEKGIVCGEAGRGTDHSHRRGKHSPDLSE